MTETSHDKPRVIRANNGRAKSLTIGRIYTTAGVHPYDEVTWERRDVVQQNWKTGATIFEQRGVEYPDFWSVNASTIVTTKYFRGAVDTDVREWSLKQLIDRVVKTYRAAGEEHGYFATPADAEVFEHELTWALLHQVFSFNSPVWFNVGTSSPQQVSACFILAVDDTMDSILNWYREEGLIFKGGSGAGLNLSRIRSSKELLSSGGTASGPVSFMRGADASAGTIKSGGATRRAAKMVVLDVDHPDIVEFVETKAKEEDKIRALRDAGFDMDLGGKDITSVQYQNANNSVRVTDEFMRAVEEGTSFGLTARGTGEVIDTVDARELFGKIASRRVGVRRPRHPVRRHDQRLAHQPRDRPDHRVQPVLGVHVAGQLLVQPGVAQPDEVPQGRRHVRRRDLRQGRRAGHHRDGHLDLLRRLPDRGDRRDDARLPPARHRLRQPGRAADGDRPRLRLRGWPGAGRDHHVADDGHVLQALRGAGRDRRSLRGLRAQRRRPQAGHAQARCRQRRDPHHRHDRPRRAPRGHEGMGRGHQDRREGGLPQRPGKCVGTDRHHRLHDGLRHHGHRARLLAGEVQEARRRRVDADRQPDDPAGAAQAGLRRGDDRGDRRVHRRARPRHRRTRPATGALRRLRLRDGRAGHRRHGPRADDGGRPAVPLRRDLQDGQPARRPRRSRRSRTSTSRAGSSASRRWRSTATTARSASRCRTPRTSRGRSRRSSSTARPASGCRRSARRR